MTDITPDLVLKAYAYGVLPLDSFHVPRSLRKRMRQGVFTVTIDKDFEGVMEGCAEASEGRADTWINDRIIHLFNELYRAGVAHSVEVWQDGKLVGGLYGLAMGAAFFGESMFSRTTDASKVALTHLAGMLIKGGFTLLDTQFITDHLKRFGAIEISQQEYLTQLSAALTRQGIFEGPLSQRDLEAVLLSHRSTQTS